MSLKMLTFVSEIDFKKKSILKYVLFSLANFANADDEAWPSYSTIAKFCSITERTAIRSIKELVKLGYLIKTNRKHSNGRDTSNIYKFDLLGVTDSQGEGDTQSPQRVTHSHSSKENHNNEPPLKHTCDIEEIFDFWKIKLNHPLAYLCDKRIRSIKRALKIYSLDDLKKAIEGCAQSEFHIKKGFDDIELICRDSTKIDRFISIFINPSLGLSDSNKKPSNNLDSMVEMVKTLARKKL